MSDTKPYFWDIKCDGAAGWPSPFTEEAAVAEPYSWRPLWAKESDNVLSLCQERVLAPGFENALRFFSWQRRKDGVGLFVPGTCSVCTAEQEHRPSL
jgi:hypothetical protein